MQTPLYYSVRVLIFQLCQFFHSIFSVQVRLSSYLGDLIFYFLRQELDRNQNFCIDRPFVFVGLFFEKIIHLDWQS